MLIVNGHAFLRMKAEATVETRWPGLRTWELLATGTAKTVRKMFSHVGAHEATLVFSYRRRMRIGKALIVRWEWDANGDGRVEFRGTGAMIPEP